MQDRQLISYVTLYYHYQIPYKLEVSFSGNLLMPDDITWS